MSFGSASFLFLLHRKISLPRGLCTCRSPVWEGALPRPALPTLAPSTFQSVVGPRAELGTTAGGRAGLGQRHRSFPSATRTCGQRGPHGRCGVGIWRSVLGAVTRGLSWRQTLGQVCILRCRHLQDVLHSPPVCGGAAPLLIIKTWPG